VASRKAFWPPARVNWRTDVRRATEIGIAVCGAAVLDEVEGRPPHQRPIRRKTWLDMAESELGAPSSQCLDRRIPDKQTLTEEVSAWEGDRNKHHAKAKWHFTAADARIKLKKLYPTL
jgi:hypothetical protein